MLLLDYEIKRMGLTPLQMVSEINYDHLSYLYAKEGEVDLQGKRLPKSYFLKRNNKEVVRQVYERVYGTHTYNGVDYENIFLGIETKVYHLHTTGELQLVSTKTYMFNLHPVFVGDGNETVVGFSSRKMVEILKAERYASANNLQSQNAAIYQFLYSTYQEYENYLKFGDKTLLIEALDNETRPEVLEVLNHSVAGTELTIVQLIKLTLQ
ncbi:hypothetical protein [Lutibacter sp.]|uniref:hypothetical protein n=1 Tax=Lutibacter sp. TaxID=1925666 RepID=UPI0035658A9E